MSVSKEEAPRRKLRVGDRVSFILGVSKRNGVIVEDRGPIGMGGRRLWAIEFPFNLGEPAVIELPEQDILAAT